MVHSRACRRYIELVMPLITSEHYLGYVLQLHPDFIISQIQIHFGEDHHSVELIQQLIYHENEKPMRNRYLVKRSIINAEPLATIFLLDQQSLAHIWSLREMDDTFS